MTVKDLDVAQQAATQQAAADAATVAQDKATLSADETKAAASAQGAAQQQSTLGSALRAIGKPYVRTNPDGPPTVVNPTDSGIAEITAVGGDFIVPDPAPAPPAPVPTV